MGHSVSRDWCMARNKCKVLTLRSPTSYSDLNVDNPTPSQFRSSMLDKLLEQTQPGLSLLPSPDLGD